MSVLNSNESRVTNHQMNDHILKCRCCGVDVQHVVVDLGLSPLCENIIQRDDLSNGEMFYPLKVYVCDKCWLVQLPDHVCGVEIFDDSYAYLSSFSSSWLAHCEAYTDQIVERLSLDEDSFVIEIASNDGYLLKNFVQRGISCLGIEPATRAAELAWAKGVPVRTEYFGVEFARQLRSEGITADLMVGNNVLAHVPDLHDFLGGFKQILSPQGTITFEFPHLLNLLQKNQFDTIYQEHYCYLSLIALTKLFKFHNFRIYDVENLSTHGGSLRIYVCHDEADIAPTGKVQQVIDEEIGAGLMTPDVYQAFARRVSDTKWELLKFLMEARQSGKKIAGYGAPGKGNTLLNYCGIREDLIDFTVDRNPWKQNTFLVGSRIPVHEPSMIDREQPDYILILPWNLRDEIVEQMSHIRQWGGKFVVPIPQLEIIG